MKAPTSWPRDCLDNVAEVQSGLSKSANRAGKTIKKPYLRVANVQDGFLDLSEVMEIDVPEKSADRYLLRVRMH